MPGAIQVSVFTNFEGWLKDKDPAADAAVAWFRACKLAYPEIVWTHLYSPSYLLIQDDIDAVFTPYLLDAMNNEGAEIGLHAHLWLDMVTKTGVTARSVPDGNTGDCSASPANPGYGVLLTGYAADERVKIIQAGIQGLTNNGFAAPKTFCAGFSAADPALQAALDQLGFSASFAAQPLPPPGQPNSYGDCWYNALPWYGNVSPLTMPYRVNQATILPPPHPTNDYLDLVEIPLNMWVDNFQLTLNGQNVTREDMFDRHVAWAANNSDSSAVAIGVHAEVVATETFPGGPVARELSSFLDHVRQIQASSGADITFSTASDIASVFLYNTTTGAVA
jgi:hypothetical protein